MTRGSDGTQPSLGLSGVASSLVVAGCLDQAALGAFLDRFEPAGGCSTEYNTSSTCPEPQPRADLPSGWWTTIAGSCASGRRRGWVLGLRAC